MPFAGYADFAACVAANSDKDNPEAYCGAIQAKVEKTREVLKHYPGLHDQKDHGNWAKDVLGEWVGSPHRVRGNLLTMLAGGSPTATNRTVQESQELARMFAEAPPVMDRLYRGVLVPPTHKVPRVGDIIDGPRSFSKDLEIARDFSLGEGAAGPGARKLLGTPVVFHLEPGAHGIDLGSRSHGMEKEVIVTGSLRVTRIDRSTRTSRRKPITVHVQEHEPFRFEGPEVAPTADPSLRSLPLPELLSDAEKFELLRGVKLKAKVTKHAQHNQKDHGNRHPSGPSKGMDPSDVADKAIKLGVHKVYASSIRDMADWASTKSGKQYGDRITGRFVDVKMARGSDAKFWPLEGSIVLTRDDGQKFRLYLKGKDYKVDSIAKHADHDQSKHGVWADGQGQSPQPQQQPRTFAEAVLPAASTFLQSNPDAATRYRTPNQLAATVSKVHDRLMQRGGFSTDDLEDLQVYAHLTGYTPTELSTLHSQMNMMSAAMSTMGPDWLAEFGKNLDFVREFFKHADHNQKDHGNRYPYPRTVYRGTPLYRGADRKDKRGLLFGPFYYFTLTEKDAARYGTGRFKFSLPDDLNLFPAGLYDDYNLPDVAPKAIYERAEEIAKERGAGDVPHSEDLRDAFQEAGYDGIILGADGPTSGAKHPNWSRFPPMIVLWEDETVGKKGPWRAGTTSRDEPSQDDLLEQFRRRYADILLQRNSVAKHYGPGPHPSGTTQDVHGGERISPFNRALKGVENTMEAIAAVDPKLPIKVIAQWEKIGGTSRRQIRDRYIRLIEAAKKNNNWADGLDWYWRQHRDLTALADQYDQWDLQTMAAAAAALSPQAEWNANLRYTVEMAGFLDHDLIEDLSDTQLELVNAKLDADGHNLTVTNGSRLSKLTPRQATIVMFEMSKNLSDANNGWGSGAGYTPFSDAVELFRGAKPNILRGVKTRSFYNMLFDPSNRLDVTIDFQMMEAAAGRVLTKNENSSLNGTPSIQIAGKKTSIGVRPYLADITRSVAAKFGITPSQAQAIIWLQWKDTK